MNKPLGYIAKLLNIQPGEEKIVGLLMALASLVSLARLFNSTAASTLFLIEFNTSVLPYTYITMAVVAPLIGYLNTRFETRIRFTRLHLYNISGYLVILGGLRLSMTLTDAGWPKFIYFIWSEIGWLFFNLMLWGVAGRLLNVRQAKRLFGLIGASGGLATIIMGAFISGIVESIGVTNLLFLVMIALSGAIGLLLYISSRYASELSESADEEEDNTGSNTSNWQVSRKYFILLITLAMLAEASFYFVDMIFYEQVQIRFSDNSEFANIPLAELRAEENIFIVPESSDVELAGFMGKYLSAMNLLVLLSNFFLVGSLISKLGLRTGLLALPVLTGVVAIVFAFGGFFDVSNSFLFTVAVFNSMLDWIVRDTIFRSSVLILYQPMPPATRSRTQTQIETIASPYAQGIVGFILAGLGALGFASLEYNWLLIVILIGFILLGISLAKNYGAALLEALSKRALKFNGESLALNDPVTRELFTRELRSPYPEAVKYALNTLDEMEYPIAQELPGLLSHAAPEVRREALLKIAKLKPEGLFDQIREAIKAEENPSVKAAGVRALAVYSNEENESEIEAHLNSKDASIVTGAMVSLLRRKKSRKDIEARLKQMLLSQDADQRIAGLRIAGELDDPEPYADLISKLLNDKDFETRKNAVWTAAQLNNDEIWNALFESLGDIHVRADAMNAIASRKENALERIRVYLQSGAPRVNKIHCIRLIGRMQNKTAVPDLLTQLEAPDVEIKTEALTALNRCGYRFDSRNLQRFRKLIRAEVADALQTITLQQALDALDNPMLLHDGLETAWTHHRERIFMLLRMLYDRAAIQQVRDNLIAGSKEKHAYAVEALDNAIADEFKPFILPMFEDTDIKRRIETWTRILSAPEHTRPMNIDSLLAASPDYSAETKTPWIKACIIQALSRNQKYQPIIAELKDDNRLIQNTIEWALKKEKKTMLSMIERVMILKTVSIFGETSDHLLAEVADLLEEQHLEEGATFISKGDPANCMYIIVQGDVKIHDGALEFDRLGARDIVGEMALLDLSTRSASATTLAPTHLLKLDRAPLFELIADRAEVAQGIIRVLAKRLRETMSAMKK